VVIIDIDHFKKVNDQYGHMDGDMVLKTICSLIQKRLPVGILARYGGEEFVLVLPEMLEDEAYQFMERLREEINQYDFRSGDGTRIPVSFSGGLANYPNISGSYEGLLHLADEALYEAKNSGRNQVCIAAVKANM
jgi:diguanylate cyclase (GGDEF)-like protein